MKIYKRIIVTFILLVLILTAILIIEKNNLILISNATEEISMPKGEKNKLAFSNTANLMYSTSSEPRHAPNMYVTWNQGGTYDIMTVDWYCSIDSLNTYWAVHNWTTNYGGAGYAGFQNVNNNHVLLLSLWDLKDGTKPTIEYVYDGKNGTFGNEGTGVQVFTNYNWENMTWYTMRVQAYTKNEKTYFEQWICKKGEKWIKTAVISYPRKDCFFIGDSMFQEDFTFTNGLRMCRLKNAYGRNSSSKTWESWRKYRITNSYFPTDSATWENGVQENISFNCNWGYNGASLYVSSGGKGFTTNSKKYPYTQEVNQNDKPEIQYMLEKYTISEETTLVKEIPDQIYTGKLIKPKVEIEYFDGANYNGEYDVKITEGVDYKVEYKNNIAQGRATVRIVGINNCVGALEKTFNIVPAPKVLNSIFVEEPPQKTSYTEGEEFNKLGMKVIATYSDGSTNTVTNYVVKPNGELTLSDDRVIIYYTEDGVTKTAEQKITVKAKILTGIEVRSNQTNYYVGESLNKEELILEAIYNNGTKQKIMTGFTCVPEVLKKPGTQTITVSYGGKTTTFTVTVQENTLSKIEVITKPSKLTYYVGDTLNASGLKIKGTYANGTTKEITSGFTCSPTELNIAGIQTITVSYEEKQATFNVIVKLKGDLNGDNQITFMDILIINKYRLGKQQLMGEKLELADITGDGKINFGDILVMNKYRLKNK